MCFSGHKCAPGLLRHLCVTHRNDDALRNSVLEIVDEWMWRAERDDWGEFHELSIHGAE